MKKILLKISSVLLLMGFLSPLALANIDSTTPGDDDGVTTPTDVTSPTTVADSTGGTAGIQADELEPTAMPTSKDECKEEGWQDFNDQFKNQGDCVSFVATEGRNGPDGPAVSGDEEGDDDDGDDDDDESSIQSQDDNDDGDSEHENKRKNR